MWSIFSRDPSKDFGYEVNEPILQDENSFWILHKGKKKVRNIRILFVCLLLSFNC